MARDYIRKKLLDHGVIVQEQLIRILQKHEDYIATDTTSESAIRETIGEIDVDEDGDIATQLSGKASTSHTHTLTGVTDLDTVEAVITYTDESTETILLVKQVVEDSEGE